MQATRVIFVSAVSIEFHKVPPESRHVFRSYRDVIKQAFRIVAPHYEVIVQEELPQGFGDLLETLDHEINRSLFVIHLVGDLAGFAPEPAPVRELYARRPDLLDCVPELRDAVGNGLGITYTQWELYLAFHHKRGRLIFEVQPGAPRSPLFAPAWQIKHPRQLTADASRPQAPTAALFTIKVMSHANPCVLSFACALICRRTPAGGNPPTSSGELAAHRIAASLYAQYPGRQDQRRNPADFIDTGWMVSEPSFRERGIMSTSRGFCTVFQ
jgi:hypothetical protein